MHEMSKSHLTRLRHRDYEWLKGNGIDVCCGPDPLVLERPSTVDTWDLENGDAQYLATIPDGKYDFLVSYHGLEHMNDPGIALKNWSRVVKEGASLLIAVPLFSAYEKFRDFRFNSEFPAKFNADHKTSWDIVSTDKPMNHEHYNYRKIVQIGKEAGLHLVDLRLELDGFHWEKWNDSEWDSTMHGGMAQMAMVFQKI
jgi:SAM-dependent methyltransferase